MRRCSLLLLAPALLLLACNPEASTPDSAADSAAPTECTKVDTWPDQDGDGYGSGTSARVGCAENGWAAADGDCNDKNPDIHPDAADLCNGIDDNCDGTKDAADTTWYADLDGDAHGDDTTAVATCEPPTGYITAGGDCNDAEATVYVGAPELCNERDDDCDGTADLGYEADWHSDADGDGYGSPIEHETTCTAKFGWVLDGTDCRPSDAAAYPGAPEACNAVDDSCDGVVDEGYDLDGDGHQDTVCATGDDCDDHAPQTFLGAAETCGDSVDQDCDGLDLHCGYMGTYNLADADVRATDSDMANTGGHLDVGDVDGDGYDDIILNGIYDGVAVVRGPLSGAVDVGNTATYFTGDLAAVYGGRSIGIGDVNDDGLDDVGFGAPYGGANGLYILYGPAAADTEGEDADVIMTGTPSTYCGHGAEIAEVTGDGISDAIMGCYSQSLHGGSGVTYLFNGPLEGEYSQDDADSVLYSTDASEYSGRWIRGDGDLNGDGNNDLMVAAPFGSSASYGGGTIYVFLGPVTGDIALPDSDARLMGSTASGYLGEYRTLIMGDSDGDGNDDALVSAYYAGDVALFYSPTSGDYETASADITVSGGTYFGTGLDVQDIDGNGVGDVLMSDMYESGSTGASYLFWDLRPGAYVPGDADATFHGESGSYAGSSTVFADLSGDGWPDIVVAAQALTTNGGFYVEDQVR